MSPTLEKESLIKIYQDLINRIWSNSSRMIGVMTNNALMEAAIYDTKGKHPFIGQIELSNDEVCIEKVLENCSDLTITQIKEGFEEFLTQLFGIFTSMTGDVIIQQWKPKVEEVREKVGKLK